MPRKRPRRCRRCSGWDHEVGRVSWSGLCAQCSATAVIQHNTAVSNKSGPEYEAWVQACKDAALTRALGPAGGTLAEQLRRLTESGR